MRITPQIFMGGGQPRPQPQPLPVRIAQRVASAGGPAAAPAAVSPTKVSAAASRAAVAAGSPTAVGAVRSPSSSPLDSRRQAAVGAATFSAALSVSGSRNSGSSPDPSSSEDEEFEERASAEELPRSATAAMATRRTPAEPAVAGPHGGSDMAVGRGHLAIPQAALSVDQATVRRRLKAPERPNLENDLREFIRAGDVLNYLGGNRWGHVVMALGSPKAYEVPVLYSAETLPAGTIPLDAFPVTLRRASSEEQWGFAMVSEEEGKPGGGANSGHHRHNEEPAHVVVKTILPGGAVEAWNAKHPEQRIRQEDRVVEVNGVRGSPQELFRAAEESNVLELKLWRWSDAAVLGYNVLLFAVEVLQSASNMRDIAESTVCLVVHPVRKVICPVGPLRDGFRVSIGHMGGPVQVQVLMSPLNNESMDFSLFRLAVHEVMRAPHDSKWSMRTAVRSYLRNAEIRPERYQQARKKMKLGSRLSERWAARPICSTVPARVWQKYFLKRAYKERADNSTSPTRGVISCSTLCHSMTPTAGNFSAEAAFADDVLRYMPVRDDRVLPEDLVVILLGTGQWDMLALDDGPPDRRRYDRGVGSRPSAAGGVSINALAPRASLPPGAFNRDGAPVCLGADQFTVYCGLKVSRPKKATARMFVGDGEPPQPATRFAWDGKCGPLQGPQCSACRWFEDRLTS